MEKKITLIYDLDETLCTKKQPGETYADPKPIQPMIDQLNRFYDEGFEIIISTARNMVTQNNHVSKVVQNVGLDTIQWLERYGVKYHGLQFGKEYGAMYIDDKACLNDPKEIERRINAVKNGTEKAYIKEHLGLRERVEELEAENTRLKGELKEALISELRRLREEYTKKVGE